MASRGPLVVGRAVASAASTTSRTPGAGGERVALREVREPQAADPADPPPSGARSPVRTSSSVVLPPPLRPTTPIRSPALDAERHGVEQDARGVAGDVGGDGLQVDQVLGGSLGAAGRHQARTGGQEAGRAEARRVVLVDDAGAGHRAVRDPHGAADADAGQLGGHVDRRVGVGAQERAGRARSPETSPASAPAVTPARRVRRRSGAMLTAAACRSLPRQRGELAGIAAGQRLQHGLDRAVRRRPSSPRSRSSSRNTLGRGQPAAVQRDHPVKRVPGQHRHDLLAAPGAERRAAVEREGDVAAELGCQHGQLVAGEVELPQRATARPVPPPRRRCPPAIPPATGMPLRSTSRTSGSRSARSASSWTARQARFVSSAGTSATPSPCTSIPGASAGREVHLVEQAHGVEHGDQVVVAVRRAAARLRDAG